jgi:copper chaperone NosL
MRAAIVVMMLTLPVTSAACASASAGPPEIVIDRTACAQCGMLISERRYAAASRSGREEARVFDDIGCLLNDVRGSAHRPELLWFNDAETGQWILPAAAPAFIRASSIRTPMGGGTLAFGTLDAARRAAARGGAALIPSTAILLAGGSQ